MVDLRSGERSVAIGDLLQHSFRRVELSLVAGQDGLQNKVTSPRIQKLGLALGGYTGYIHPGRVQFLGGTENHFLQTMDEARRSLAFENLQSRPVCCIVTTKGFEIPDGLRRFCNRKNIPLLSTSSVSSLAIAEVTAFLEEALAAQVSIHGVLMDIYGLGVLLCGDSGVGKSECAMDLIIRGHRLVSDDLVCIMRQGGNTLIGKGSENLQFHLELRGLGIIDVRELFGISVLRQEIAIGLAVRFEVWSKEPYFDRVGLEEETMEILDVHVPLRRMPVAPGRNLATLVEVAARLELLRTKGTFASE